VIWYSPEFYAWLKANRPENATPRVEQLAEQPVPDGAIAVKEMYPPPGAACAGVDPIYLMPDQNNGAAIMVRDSAAAQDGWFWGWYGWPGSVWSPDWPASSGSPLPSMGFGQYCVNCHASAKANQTFAALKNIQTPAALKNINGEPAEPLVFLSQDFFLNLPAQAPLAGALATTVPRPVAMSLHARIAEMAAEAKAQPTPPRSANVAATALYRGRAAAVLTAAPSATSPMMPPMTYDNVWVKGGALTVASQFMTSDQCLGCHSAGGTGLQFDMTQPATPTQLLNISPYGTWRGSPMGLAGRDPVFFAQLSSETEKFHPPFSAKVQDTCLGCHGILGQRQFGIDNKCELFKRTTVDAVPYPADGPTAQLAHYGGLARDGISCAACHHMVLGDKDSAPVANLPQNVCVVQRQDDLNPGFTGFAKTFSGSFFVGATDRFYGPFDDPKTKPMNHAMGIDPAYNANVKTSELCGTCHTVHLPIMAGDQTIGHVYEQLTYPEWAFSAYRTGTSPDGQLPFGAGSLAQSCQDCHMPSKDTAGNPYPSKIAAIQEHTNFPEADNTLPPDDIDLPVRGGFAKHTLVGLNVVLLEMAKQFPKELGIRLGDPMLGGMGIDSIPASEAAMVDQAVNKTVTIAVSDVKNDGQSVSAKVTLTNHVGHKFPSGVGFRRAFVEFDVLDASNTVLWSSGRTDANGVIVDGTGTPIDGELWWKNDCSARTDPLARKHQQHYLQISDQSQAQIYQELVSTPPPAGTPPPGPQPAGTPPPPECGPGSTPAGELTTSFLSICSTVKDNRLLPQGFLSLPDRKTIATALGADALMAEETEPVGVEKDPNFSGGGDSLIYSVKLSAFSGKNKPVAVQAILYYQPTPPFFLQDRLCTAKGDDRERLDYILKNIALEYTPAASWKISVGGSGTVAVP
jgi:hypothetical protein